MIKHYITLAIITIFMVGAVVFSFLSGGSPQEARNKRLDQAKLTSLQTITYSVDSYYNQYKSLPQSLDDLKKINTSTIPTDPDTSQYYEYKVIDKNKYNLCTTFKSGVDL